MLVIEMPGGLCWAWGFVNASLRRCVLTSLVASNNRSLSPHSSGAVNLKYRGRQVPPPSEAQENHPFLAYSSSWWP